MHTEISVYNASSLNQSNISEVSTADISTDIQVNCMQGIHIHDHNPI